MSYLDEVEAKPSSAPYELETAEDPAHDHSAQHNHLTHDNPDHSSEAESELEEQFSSVSLDQSEPHLNSSHSPSLSHSLPSPPHSDTSPSHTQPHSQQPHSPDTSTDVSLATTTQPSSTQSVNKDQADDATVDTSIAKPDAQSEPPTPAPAPGPQPEPTPQPKPSTSAQTTMQKVISFTRQRDLPPKSKEEEVSNWT